VHRLANNPELLDGPLDPATLAGNLSDLARVNRLMGGSDISWRAVAPLLAPLGAASPVRLLDVGTGAADIPVALARRAAAAGLDLRIVATDVRPEIVALAEERVLRAGVKGVEIGASPHDHLDAGDGSFEIVHSSMVLHHLEPAAAVAMLREMRRVASRAVIVNDLTRGDHWWLGARLLASLTTTNEYTRHDGPLSVCRAYKPNEVRQLAQRAGLEEEGIYWARPAYRYAFVFTAGSERAA